MSNAAEPDGVLRGAAAGLSRAGVDLTPLTATVMYLAFGSVLLVASNFFLPAYASGELLTELQTIKSVAEILVTGGFIFLVTKGSRCQLRGANRRLTRQREEIDVLHRVLRHNLRNKLNVIAASVSMLTDRADDVVDGEVVGEQCARVTGAVEELLDLTETARYIQRVSDSEATARFDAVECLGAVVASVAESHGSVRVTTSFPERASIEAHTLFREAAAELVHNAVRHNDGPDPEVAVTLTDGGRRGRAVIEIRDNGPGIPEAVTEVVLDGNRDEVHHCNGLGLWFAYWCVDASGGEMEIETADGGGSCVRLRMPRA